MFKQGFICHILYRGILLGCSHVTRRIPIHIYTKRKAEVAVLNIYSLKRIQKLLLHIIIISILAYLSRVRLFFNTGKVKSRMYDVDRLTQMYFYNINIETKFIYT